MIDCEGYLSDATSVVYTVDDPFRGAIKFTDCQFHISHTERGRAPTSRAGRTRHLLSCQLGRTRSISTPVSAATKESPPLDCSDVPYARGGSLTKSLPAWYLVQGASPVAEVVGESDQDGIIFRDEPAVAGIGVQEPDCQPCVNTESTIRI